MESGPKRELVIEQKTLDDLHDLLGGDLDAIIRQLLAQLPAQLAALEAALDGGDLRSVSQLAHAMKGSVANLGGRALAETAGQVERAANSGESVTLRGLRPFLVRLVTETIAALAAYAGERRG